MTDPSDDLRALVEPIRAMSDREVQAFRWLAAVEADKLERDARSWRAVEALLASEGERRADVLAELDPDRPGGVA